MKKVAENIDPLAIKKSPANTGWAIQGYMGSFHQEAAFGYFGENVKVIPCSSFKEVMRIAGSKKESQGAVMAIENSIAGSILANYNLLQKSNLQITGEIYLQINQNLLVNRNVKIDSIREVHSHPMAIQQCLEYLDKHKWKLIETEDTAQSAKLIRQHKSSHIAAIAGKLAAKLYDLKVIAPNIQSMKNNYTRFLVIQHAEKAELVRDPDKASVNFNTDHSKGSLARVLTRIAEAGINLSKLQSFPIPGTEFKYSFHVDMEFATLSQFQKVIEDIRPLTTDLKVYGIYKKGLWK